MPRHTLAERMSHSGTRVQSQNRHKGLKVNDQIDVVIGSPNEEQPRPSDSSFKREIAASLIQNHRSVETNPRAMHNVSPASYNNSIEATPFNCISPRTFIGFEGKIGNSHLNLETLNELALVLNRIWILEEQHTSNISLVNTMKRELDQSHMRIKVLLREKSKEQERVKAIIKSIKEELEDEKILKKHSERLHKKLARELLEIKTSFAETLKEHEREKKSRLLLENLCDEFAKGIRIYEQEVRRLKHKPNKELFNRESLNKLILRSKSSKRSLSADKLALKKPFGISLAKLSSESLQLNESTSAPRDTNDGNDSTSTFKEKPKLDSKKKLNSRKKQGKVEGVEDLKLNQILSLKEETLREDNEATKVTSKRAHGSKESTLKAKLLEARLEGHY